MSTHISMQRLQRARMQHVATTGDVWLVLLDERNGEINVHLDTVATAQMLASAVNAAVAVLKEAKDGR